MKILSEAPKFLASFYVNEGKAKEMLSALLTDKRMASVWKRLGRRIKTSSDWLRFWQEIKNALAAASPKKKLKRASEEAEDWKRIAILAEEVAKIIRIEPGHAGYKGFLDLECHHFFPAEVMRINGIPNWDTLSPSDQLDAASDLMPCWATMSELLENLHARALMEARAVPSKRVVEKDKGRRAETMFSRRFHSHLSKYDWEPTDQIFAAIATIATIADELGFLKTTEHAGVSPKFVRNAILGTA